LFGTESNICFFDCVEISIAPLKQAAHISQLLFIASLMGLLIISCGHLPQKLCDDLQNE
jgi:hypothetical protein